MTGPEHYAEAERLLDLADEMAVSDAQVHATLALAAATALGALHAEGWADVAAAPRRPTGGAS